eukprot:m.260246 g.260246  ORF g.260246 m.260246 type:complete len:501 (-) comp39536_c0_seq1:138-1640(-)
MAMLLLLRKFVVLALLALVTSSSVVKVEDGLAMQTITPGFELGLTNVGMEYAKNVLVPILEKLLVTVAIPDIHAKDSGFSIDITSVKVKGVNIQGATVAATTAGIGLSLTAQIGVGANFHYREDDWPHVSDGGSIDMGGEITIDLLAKFGISAKSEPTIDLGTCSSNIGDFSIDFHGGASWFYNLFKSLFSNTIKDALNKELCAVTKLLQGPANSALAKLAETVDISNDVSVSYALVKAPETTATYLLTSHNGRFMYNKTSVDWTHDPAVITLPSALPKMLYVFVTDYAAETAVIAYQKAGVLDFTITPSMVPPSIPIQLNTSDFQLIAPQMAAKYPNHAMEMELEATSFPADITTNSSGIDVRLNFLSNFFVLNGTTNVTAIPAFTLNTTVYAAGFANCTSVTGSSTLHFSVKVLKLELAVVSSNFGPVEASGVQVLVNFAVDELLIPQINKAGATGIRIPTVDGLIFMQPQITFGDGFIRVETDIRYTGPSDLGSLLN